MTIPRSHPRYSSLKTRELLGKGVKEGITSLHGLIAHGRGEAFDYLLGENTRDFAYESIQAAAALLLAANHPIISVNGNTAALVAKELVMLADLLHAPLEINLFHASSKRLQRIKTHLQRYNAKTILLPYKKHTIKYLDSNRKYVNPKGTAIADVIFVPLEDGDRAEALIRNEKKVITVDLNPLSRTAQTSTITIVDNVIRALPRLIGEVSKNNLSKQENARVFENYNNNRMLRRAIQAIRKSK